ncbi:MAG: hydantoinase B/oxoprolinase family protein [Chloroflexi bacterium]|nr:hydantoinase B/oxoprolinase family protein [Chloroflexota bacterium]
MNEHAVGLDPADLAVVWSRLIAISDQMWLTIRRTAFSPIISTALDFGCGLLAANGGQLAMGAVGMASFNLALPTLARDILRRYAGRIHPGDVFIGNDPWLCIGHLDDVAVITPVFDGERHVAFVATVAHQANIGGALSHRRVREVYEEGVFIPNTKLYARGERNDTMFDQLRANVRMPDLVLGDLEAMVGANEIGAGRLLALMREYHLADVEALAAELQGRSERAMREIIRALPDGTYRSEGLVDGLEAPVHIKVSLRVAGDEIFVDYPDAPPEFPYGGMNVTETYTVVNTHYLLECALAPHLPHNEGSIQPLHVTAPEGSVLACRFPASVGLRHTFTTRVSSIVLAAIAQVAPGRAMAGYGTIQVAEAFGRRPSGAFYSVGMIGGGGRGGSAGRDGIGGFIYTSGAASTPVEYFEQVAPILVTERQWQADSAGAGEFRGGMGQQVSLRRLPGHDLPVGIRFTPSRRQVGAPGLFGGSPGSLTDATWNGRPITPDSDLGRDGLATIHSDDDVFRYHVSSGGGFGDPRARAQDAVERDLRLGLVTPEGARRDYRE